MEIEFILPAVPVHCWVEHLIWAPPWSAHDSEWSAIWIALHLHSGAGWWVTANPTLRHTHCLPICLDNIYFRVIIDTLCASFEICCVRMHVLLLHHHYSWHYLSGSIHCAGACSEIDTGCYPKLTRKKDSLKLEGFISRYTGLVLLCQLNVHKMRMCNSN